MFWSVGGNTLPRRGREAHQCRQKESAGHCQLLAMKLDLSLLVLKCAREIGSDKMFVCAPNYS